MIKAVENYSDEELIEMLKGVHRSNLAIRYLYRSCYKGVSSYIQQNSGSKQDAEDIFQEVIVSFIELVKKEKFRGDSSIKTFIYTLTKYTWLNELKKRGRATLREEKYEVGKYSSEEDVSTLIVEREAKRQVMEIIDRIGELCKQILVAFYYDNLSMKEILSQVELQNEQVLRNKKYKCLKSLGALLSANPELAQKFKNSLSYGG